MNFDKEVTDCNRIGNFAKILEALEQIHELLSIGGKPDTAMCIRYEAAYQIAEEALSAKPRNCDCHLAKNLIGAVTLYCSKNPELPPMVEWNAIQYLEFCKWLFAESKED